jgi:hypothetical protein
MGLFHERFFRHFAVSRVRGRIFRGRRTACVRHMHQQVMPLCRRCPGFGTAGALVRRRRGGPPSSTQDVRQRTAELTSGLAGSLESGRGYEPRHTTTHQLRRPASLVVSTPTFFSGRGWGGFRRAPKQARSTSSRRSPAALGVSRAPVGGGASHARGMSRQATRIRRGRCPLSSVVTGVASRAHLRPRRTPRRRRSRSGGGFLLPLGPGTSQLAWDSRTRRREGGILRGVPEAGMGVALTNGPDDTPLVGWRFPPCTS